MIDPTAVSTIRVGELSPEPFSLTDNIPHEVGTELKRGTIEDLATFISAFIGSTDGVGFRAISVTDGQTLPTTTQQEFILVGKGTYYNVVGGSTIICTEELNAIVSNGSYWFIGVEIPVNVELAGITQFIRDGFISTTPSEDAVYDALALKANVADSEDVTNKVSIISTYSTTLYPNEKATHDALDLKLNISDLPTNLTLYPTNVASDVSGYVKMVTDIHAPDYNTVAVDISTPTITTTDQLVASLITDAGVLIGQPGVFNATTFGNIRRLSGSGTATFYFKVFHRDSTGTETLIGTSSNTEVITSSSYLEFTGALLWDDGDFIDTDRIVIKYYANRIAGSSDPVYQFQFGGATPVRTLLPVPFSVVDAGYELKANKQNSLAIDGTGTKYPTVDAVNNALPTTYSKVVYVNATSPTTSTIFDTENPPVTNDNALKNDTANLYIGTDASTWVYLTGTGYVTKTVSSATSNFNTFGTTVDAGNSKTSHITRSGAVTLTGPLNILNLKIATTPTTSAGSYDILTRNSSTTALERKLVSDFVQTTGVQTILGEKIINNTGTGTGKLVLNNQFSGFVLYGVNSSTGTHTINNNNSTGQFYQNTNSLGAGIFTRNTNNSSSTFSTSDNFSTGIFEQNQNISTGIFHDSYNTNTGIFDKKRNDSSGILNYSNSKTGSTGDLQQYLKNDVVTTYINHLGEIITMSPTAINQVVTKGYADAKITQTITNGVTDKSPSEDAVFDALALKVAGSGTTNYVPKFTSSGTIGGSQLFDNGTNVGVGTASPSYKMHIKSTAVSLLAIERDGGGNANMAFINTGATRYFGMNATGGFGIGSSVDLGVAYFLLSPTGTLLLNTTTDDGVATNRLQVNGNVKATQFRISALNTAPTSATDTGTLGEVRITATYIYVCTATNTWVRTALTTW